MEEVLTKLNELIEKVDRLEVKIDSIISAADNHNKQLIEHSKSITSVLKVDEIRKTAHQIGNHIGVKSATTKLETVSEGGEIKAATATAVIPATAISSDADVSDDVTAAAADEVREFVADYLLVDEKKPFVLGGKTNASMRELLMRYSKSGDSSDDALLALYDDFKRQFDSGVVSIQTKVYGAIVSKCNALRSQ